MDHEIHWNQGDHVMDRGDPSWDLDREAQLRTLPAHQMKMTEAFLAQKMVPSVHEGPHVEGHHEGEHQECHVGQASDLLQIQGALTGHGDHLEDHGAHWGHDGHALTHKEHLGQEDRDLNLEDPQRHGDRSLGHQGCCC